MKKNISQLIFLTFIFLLISPIVLAQVPPDKSLIKSSDSPKVYWLQNNVYYWILDEAAFNKMSPLWSFANVIEYPAATFNSQIINNPSYRQGPNFVSDNLLIKKTSPTIESTVFLTYNNQRRAFFNYDALIDPSYNLQEPNIISVTQTLRDSISSGDFIYAIGHDSGRINLFRDAFNRAGGTNNLGYARTAAQPWGTGQIQYFKRLNDNSAIVYNPNQNYAYSTYGAIYTKYTARGANIYGFPIGDLSDGIVSSITGAKPVYQRFSGGSNTETSINHHFTGPKAGLTVETHTPILEKWAAIGYGASCAGLPTSDVYSWQNGLRSDFENGYIYWDGQRTIASCEPTQDECTQGATRCSTSSAKQTCGNYDEDVWLEWGNDLTCAFGCNAGTGQCNQGSSCSNEIKDGDETDIDCGGSCSACPNNKACSINNDCQSTYCNPNNICSVPSCTDGWRNGNELGIDCGGSCSACQTPACENPAGGDEVIVNTNIPLGQTFPAIAMGQQGNFITAWHSYIQDGDENGIFAQRFDSNGDKLGNEFQANTYTNGHQEYPSIAMDINSNFVITWMSEGQDGSSYGIYAQRFDSNGNKLGNEFRVNTYMDGIQAWPAIAMDSQGNFVITWASYLQDGSPQNIYAQRFDSSGNKLGGEFRVNTYLDSFQIDPAIVMGSQGNFVITWQSDGQDGSGSGIYARRYDAQGNPLGNEFIVNTNTANAQTFPSIAIDSSANFVITWQSSHTGASNIYAQRFNSNGDRILGEFLVNSIVNSPFPFPNVAMDSQGEFIITWRTDWPFNIYAKRFDNNGNPLGNEFQVNTYITFEDDDRPIAAITSKSNFVILWHSWRNEQTPDSNRQYDIIARIFKCASLCSNGAKDPTETDIDCGGSCPACSDGKICSINNDCTSNYCNPTKICSIPSCTDGWKNGNEVGIDCGGSCSACPAEKVKGVDVSHWQGIIDWKKVYEDGYRFAFVKATEDTNPEFNDRFFVNNMKNSTAAGLVVGAYHFARPNNDNDATDEAKYFVNVIKDYLKGGYLRPVLDIEKNGGLSKTELSKWVNDWMSYVKEETGIWPIIYTGVCFSKDNLDESIKKYDLWISDYHAYEFTFENINTFLNTYPRLDWAACDTPWDKGDWDFWQFTSRGSEIPGIFPGKECREITNNQGEKVWVDCVDLNVFNGSIEQLQTFFIPNNLDSDNDGLINSIDKCPFDDDCDDDGLTDGNKGTEDANINGIVDVGETDPETFDTDGDGISDGVEKGITAPQGEDTDMAIFIPDADPSTTTDPTNPDSDGDGLLDGQEDSNQNGGIDTGESSPTIIDTDLDTIEDSNDNCPSTANPTQEDNDNDGKGDVCDICIADPQNDMDADSICGDIDNCPLISNPDQLDADKNTVGDACNEFEDSDGDEYANNLDNCPLISNSGQEDLDKDNIGDICDPQTCNNNIIETGEECDISTLGGKVCKDLGFDTGTLSCSQTCTFDIAQCYDNQFLRGDANSDGSVDISDPIKTLFYLYSNAQLSCKETADSNDDGKIDISDTIYALNFIFKNGPSIKQPYPALGIDTTPETPDLGCELYSPQGQGGGGGLTPEDILKDPTMDQVIKDIVKPYTCLLNGDVDQNKKVDMNDYYSLSYALSGKFKIDELCKCNVDVNEDKLINQNDVTALYNSIRYNKPLVKEGECEKLTLAPSPSPSPSPYR